MYKELLIEKYIKPTIKYLNGNEYWLDSLNEFNSVNNQPAYISYYANGQIYYKFWYKNGKINRDKNKPAFVKYDTDGKILIKQWYKEGEFFKKADY